MSVLRASAVIAVLSLVAAAAVALTSRAPADVRAEPSPSPSTDPSLGATFTPEQVARHGAYRGPSYLTLALTLALEIAALALLARGPIRRVYEWTENLPGGWVTRAATLAVVIAAILFLARLPLSYVRGYAIEYAWGLSTQDVGGWLSDRVKSLGISVIIAAVAAVAFFAIVRAAPRLWWLWGWAIFTALTALLIFLYPVVIAPLFNRFTPIADQELAARIRSLANEAGVSVDEVLVADASRRTTTENAYVAGLGATKRVVLYDTLLASGSEDETMFVVAHELGHEVDDHLPKQVVISSVGLFLAFVALWWLSRRTGVWAWAGASGVGDLRALPLLLLFATVAAILVTPAQTAISRSFEARADQIAVSLTQDSDTAIRSFRRLAFSNLADLRPPEIAVVLLYTHPPVADRIRNALEASGQQP